MKTLLHKFQRGQGMTEYIIIIALIAIAAIGVYQLFGSAVRSQTATTAVELSASSAKANRDVQYTNQTIGMDGVARPSSSSGSSTGNGSHSGSGAGSGTGAGSRGGAGSTGSSSSGGGIFSSSSDSGGGGISSGGGGSSAGNGGSGGYSQEEQEAAQREYSRVGDEQVERGTVEERMAHKKANDKGYVKYFLVFLLIAVAIMLFVYMLLAKQNRMRYTEDGGEAIDYEAEAAKNGGVLPAKAAPAASTNNTSFLDKSSQRRNKIIH